MRHTSKSSLFLIELIIAILFFSLAAVVCVQLFSASYLATKEIEYRDTAILEAQTAAEIFRNEDGDMDAVANALNATICGENLYSYTIIEEEVEYQVLLQVSGEEDLPRADIQVIPPNTEEAIIEISTQVYVPQLDGEGE